MPFSDDDHSKGEGRNIQLLISTKVSSTKSLLDLTGRQKYSTQYRSESENQGTCRATEEAQTSAAQLTHSCQEAYCSQHCFETLQKLFTDESNVTFHFKNYLQISSTHLILESSMSELSNIMWHIYFYDNS